MRRLESGGRATAIFVLVLVLAGLLAGCRADVNVGVESRADGTGRVRVEVVVDKDVTDRVDLSAALKVDDLRTAGWTVKGPEARPAGMTAVEATKAFSDPAGASRAMAQLGGPFSDFRIRRKRTFFTTTTSFRGTFDLSRGVESFGDPGVNKALGGSDIGLDTKQLERLVSQPLDNVFHVSVSARLPGAVSSNAPSSPGNGAVWRPKLGDRADMAADARQLNAVNIGGAVVAVLAALSLLVYLVTSGPARRSYRARHVA